MRPGLALPALCSLPGETTTSSTNQAQIGHPVSVQGVTGTTGLVGVVADLRALLLSVQGLDGGVDVQYPRRVQCGLSQLLHSPALLD
jgi:hypothetical protein